MIRLYEVRLEIGDNADKLKTKCEKLTGCKVLSYKLVKKSIDARKKKDIYYSCTVDCEISGRIKSDKRIKYAEVNKEEYTFPVNKIDNQKIIVVGSGPAGLFCALCLARCGLNPIMIERGSDVDKRVNAINSFFEKYKFDKETNIQFGEGGAGTFSDGKLNTGINDTRIKFVLNEFVKFGAPENILYDSAPHIGTDVLRTVVKNIRNEIINLGGKVYFDTKLCDLICEGGKIVAIKALTNDKEITFECDKLILAIGHSARDTVKMLYKRGMKMDKKMFSVGVRIEHKQEMINKALYGDFYKKLPSAPYKLWTHINDESSLYTFCMCPGGYVVNAASEEGMVVTNGMSNNKRDGENANSALLVNIKFSDDDIFSGMKLQETLERKGFLAGGNNYDMPVQLLGDFLKGSKSTYLGDVEPTVRPGYTLTDLNYVLPDYVANTIKLGVLDFDKKINGFASYDSVITGPETRSSSPIKIIRDNITLQTNIEGIYSAGEGGGHAGGITSSAVDGIKVAEAIANKSIG